MPIETLSPLQALLISKIQQVGWDFCDEVKIIVIGYDIWRVILVNRDGGEFAEVFSERANFF